MPLCEQCGKTAYYALVNDIAKRCRQHRTMDMINTTSCCEYPDCKSSSKAFDVPNGKGRFCKKHASDGMINVKNPRCEHSGCTSTSVTFDFLGGKGRFCKDHALSTMINVRSVLCEYDGCLSKSRNFDVPGGKGRVCGRHKQDGMVNVRRHTCIYPGCTTSSSYNEKGKPPRYCSEHKLPGMCSHISCIVEGCTTIASYRGVHAKNKVPTHCCTHKQDGMISNNNNICRYAGCMKTASFGKRGSIPSYCGKHKEETMVNLVARYCNHPRCMITASYGFPAKRPQYCYAHKLDGMVCVITKGCQFPGCRCMSKNYDFPEGKGRFCTTHREPGMVDVLNKKCDECPSIACYGRPGASPTKCSRHRQAGMLSRPRARCVVCRKPAIYGTHYIPRHCEAHKLSEDHNLMERVCTSCGLTMVLDENDKCEFCKPDVFQTGRLVKQNALMSYLDNQGLHGVSTDAIVDNGICGKERPDRIFDFGDKIIILECDEHQHRDRPCLCEQTRMVNISQSFGGLPVYFIRWNPDHYISKARRTEPVENRHKLVCKFIQDIRQRKVKPPKALLAVTYFYYDGWTSAKDIQWDVLSPYHTNS